MGVSSNTANPGGTVGVTGPANSTVYVYVPGSGKKNVPVKLDKDGKATVKVPAWAEDEFVITDLKFPRPVWIVIQVVQPG